MRLKIKNVEFRYNSKPILRDVCMEVTHAEIVSICGPNGAGKTTLLRCINRVLEPNKGSILLDGEETKHMSMSEIARHMGYVPQITQTIFPITVFEMILMGRRPYLEWKNSEEDVNKVIEILQLMKLEDLAMQNFDELSGGQRQKVIIARALAQEPEVFLLDEPTSNLDIYHQLEVMDILKELVSKKKFSVVMAIHNLNLAARYSDRVILMADGKIVAAGNVDEVLTPENIRGVYGVDVEVISDSTGRPYIIPVKRVYTSSGRVKNNARYT